MIEILVSYLSALDQDSLYLSALVSRQMYTWSVSLFNNSKMFNNFPQVSRHKVQTESVFRNSLAPAGKVVKHKTELFNFEILKTYALFLGSVANCTIVCAKLKLYLTDQCDF